MQQYISGKIFLNSDIVKISRAKDGVCLHHEDGRVSHYDKVVLALHAPDALKLLDDASEEETEILSAFAYKQNDAVLHTDTNALYPDKNIYAAWNYKSNEDKDTVTLSYWINRLQNLQTKKEYFVSLNEIDTITQVIERISYEHPQFNTLAIRAQESRDIINGQNNTYYAGAYWRYGFHEDGLWSANTIAEKFGCAL